MSSARIEVTVDPVGLLHLPAEPVFVRLDAYRATCYILLFYSSARPFAVECVLSYHWVVRSSLLSIKCLHLVRGGPTGDGHHTSLPAAECRVTVLFAFRASTLILCCVFTLIGVETPIAGGNVRSI